jgi:hypothetical protein
MTNMTQTEQQIHAVCSTWKLPAGFITEGEVGGVNGRTLRQYIDQNFGGVFSHANLDAAVARLGDRIAYNVKIVERAPAQTQDQINAVYSQ